MKPVAFAKVEDYTTEKIELAIENLFQSIPSTDKINETTKILLKPNLLAKHVPEHAVTTHPEVIRGVIKACKKRGARSENILIADSPGGIYNPTQMRSFYKTCGLTAVSEAEGVQLYTACESEIYPVTDGKVVKEFEIIKPILEVDFIINLPKFKTHVMTGMTAATKNMFGVIPGLKKSEWHMRFPDKERFGHMLIDLLETITPDFAILDGVLAMEGDGPAGGQPRNVGILMASEDMLNMDLAIAHMMGLEPKRVPYLHAAIERGMCNTKFQLEDALGDVKALIRIEDWKLPESYAGNSTGNTDFVEQVPKILRPIVKRLEEKLAPHPVIDQNLCIGCGKCAEICSQDTIVLKNKKAKIIKKGCIRCFCCHEVCPVKAIDVRKFQAFKL